MRYALLIKGGIAAASRLLYARVGPQPVRLQATYDRPMNMTNAVVEWDGPHAVTLERSLSAWLTDPPRTPPFPNGSLLYYYRPIDGGGS